MFTLLSLWREILLKETLCSVRIESAKLCSFRNSSSGCELLDQAALSP
jgi:hypothetical protein